MAADELRGNVGNDVGRRKAPADHEPDGDRRIEVGARYRPDGIGHDRHREPEGERDAQDADAGGVGDGRAAAEKDQEKGADRLGSELLAVHTAPRVRRPRADCAEPRAWA